MSLLEGIKSPADLRKLSMTELTELAAEMRDVIFNAVSQNGGHLASNLGVVELTIALHYVYNFGPYPAGPDRLLWDVGHQSYPHKLLTGRSAQFAKLRKKGSVSGFPSPEESPYDLFAVGHAGTAVSTAVGMARGDQQIGRANNVVAVVGDASIVNGLAFEGLNGAGTLRRQMLVVLNDNGMSISKPQGAFAQYLERVRVSATYEEAKKFAKRIVDELPAPVSHTIEGAWVMFREGVKHAMWPSQMFESLGVKYFGPLDGHDLPGLINTLAEIKHVQAPILLHVKTIKGHGHEAACSDPTKFHSPAAFRVEGCRVEIPKGNGKSWTTAFADAMIKLANSDPRVIALTAAMPDGTGLSKYEKAHPKRYIDTGICESHLAAMAAGMCKSGLRPFAAVYSTFTQRAFDQIWQEIVLNRQPVVFCMDRAGLSGDDGPTHHGLFDISYLRGIPEMVLMAPKDENELADMMATALTLDGPSAIRYPRGAVACVECKPEPQPIPVGKAQVLTDGSDVAVLGLGPMTTLARELAERLERDGFSSAVINPRFVKPIDREMLAQYARRVAVFVTFEDHVKMGGFGSAVIEALQEIGIAVPVVRIGWPDQFIEHGKIDSLRAKYGVSVDEAYTQVLPLLHSRKRRTLVAS